MSKKRLSKRQLREQEELQSLSVAGASSSSDAASHAPMPPVEGIEEEAETSQITGTDEKQEEEAAAASSNRGGLFSKLSGVQSESEEGSEHDSNEQDENEPATAVPSDATKSKKKKKRRKKPEDVDAAASIPPNDAKARSASKNNKNATPGQGGKSAKDVSDMSMEELSALLASQSQLDKDKIASGATVPTSNLIATGPVSSFRAHLSLSAPYLDPSVELKRQFGSAAIRAYESEASASAGRGAGSAASAAARARSNAWNTNFKVRSILVQPQDTWPPIAKTFTGMTMETYTDDKGAKKGVWVHSRAYRKAQMQFLQAVQSYEPNHLISLLRLYPWHIDTLLQLSEVSRHQGDLGQASDWNARALFAYERTSTTVFSSSLTSQMGPPLLDFDRIEDRGFWIACHRHVNFLGRRGTWRTALEWVKLMLGLDPGNDHHGMILWLDFLSIKSRQHSWFLQCLAKMEAAYADEMESRGEYIHDAKTPFDEADEKLIGDTGRGSLDWCLGIAYARALAYRALEKEEGDKEGKRSTAALRLAIVRHPQLLPLLFDKIGLSFPNEMRQSSFFASAGTSRDTTPMLLAQIYVARSESLWRETDVSTWLRATLMEAWPVLEKQGKNVCAPMADHRSKMGIYRHVLVSDLPDALRQSLIGMIPKEITSDGSKLNAYDPLPPARSSRTTYYNDEYFEPVTREERRQEGREGAAAGRGAMGGGLMNQLMNALRGARGMEGWNAAMEDMDDETREDVMAQIMQMNAMPGALDSEGAQIGEDNDNDGAQAGLGGNFSSLRQLLGTLWGGAEEQAHESAETDSEEE